MISNLKDISNGSLEIKRFTFGLDSCIGAVLEDAIPLMVFLFFMCDRSANFYSYFHYDCNLLLSLFVQ